MLALLFVALLLRLPSYGQSIWADEVMTSRLMVGSNLLLLKAAVADAHPPVYFVLISLWTRVFGDGELLLRLIPLLFGLLGVALTFELGRTFVSRRAGLVAALLLALSPVHVWYSREARPYTTTLVLTLGVVLLHHRALRAQATRATTAGYALVALLLAFVHYYAFATLAVLTALTLLDRRPGRRRVLRVNVAILALYAVYLTVKLRFTPMQTGADFLRPFGLGEWFTLFFEWFPTGYVFDPPVLPDELERGTLATLRRALGIAVQVLAVALFLRGTLRLFRKPRGDAAGPEEASPRLGARPTWMLALAAAVPALLLVLPFVGFPRTYVERSALPALPFFLVVVASGLVEGVSPAPARRRVVAATATCLVAQALLFGLRDHWTVYKPHPDWRSLAAHLDAELDAGAAHRALFFDGANPMPLTYYDERFQQADGPLDSVPRTERLREAIASVLGETSALGRSVGDLAERSLDEYADLRAARWAGCRVPMYPLRDGSLEALRLEERCVEPVFWVLLHRVAGETYHLRHEVFVAPEVEVLGETRFRSLRLFEMRWRSWDPERAPEAPPTARGAE